MPKPTVQEWYDAPSEILTDNFDLHDLQMLHGPRMNPLMFKLLRDTLRTVSWEDALCPDSPNSGHITLCFSDVDGGQDFLDAHRAVQSAITDLSLNLYNESGKLIRVAHFYQLTFVRGNQSLSATECKGATRTNTYAFVSRREVKAK